MCERSSAKITQDVALSPDFEPTDDMLNDYIDPFERDALSDDSEEK